jgi:hypothetical protein
MNKILGFLLITFFFGACDKKTNPDGCIRVRVHGLLCGQANLVILDKNFEHLGEDGWKDAEGNLQDNIFHAILNCNDLEYFNRLARPSYVGMELTVKIHDTVDASWCGTCKALLHGPKTRYNISIENECE